jgi:hypothetical protein
MKSFLQGKKSLDVAALRLPPGLSPTQVSARESLRHPTTAKPAAHGHAHTSGAAGASVEVVKEGDKVVRLIVTCTCGERVEVECLYPPGL